MFVDLIMAIDDSLGQLLIDADSISCIPSANDFVVSYIAFDTDGNRYPKKIVIPAVSSDKAGLMTPQKLDHIYSRLDKMSKQADDIAVLLNYFISGGSPDALPLRMEIDTQGDTTMAWGERLPVVCTVWRGFDELTQQVTGWTVSRDTGVPQDDAAWALKPKVKGFAGQIELCFTDAENDLGNPVAGITTLFTFTAEIGPGEQAAFELALG